MKTAENLFKLLGIRAYTQRHIKIVNDFIESKEMDVKKLLDKLGDWDKADLAIAQSWMNLDPKTL